jgi:hypothetical protein
VCLMPLIVMQIVVVVWEGVGEAIAVRRRLSLSAGLSSRS